MVTVPETTCHKRPYSARARWRTLLFIAAAPVAIVCSRPVPTSAPSIEWCRVYPGFGWSCGASVAETPDRGFIVVGRTDSVTPLSGEEQGLHGAPSSRVSSFYYFVVKTDSLGHVQWSNAYSATRGGEASSVQTLTDGGFLVAGDDMSRARFVRLDSTGNLVWQRAILTDSEPYTLRAITPASGSDFYMTIVTDMSRTNVLRVDSLGRRSWSQTFRRYTEGNGWTTHSGLAAMPEGGCVAVAGEDVVRFDDNGRVVWKTELHGRRRVVGFAASPAPRNGCVVAGALLPGPRANPDVGLAKYSTKGKLEWLQSHGGLLAEAVLAVQPVAGGYILAGVQATDTTWDNFRVLIVRTDSKGDVCWTKNFGAPGYYNDARSICQTSDQGYAVTGECADSLTGALQMYLLKLAPDTNRAR